VDPRDERDDSDDLFDDDRDGDGAYDIHGALIDETDDMSGPLGDLRGPIDARRDPIFADDEEDGGLGPAFDPDEEETEDVLAPPLDDDASEDLLTRYLAVEKALTARWPESKLEPSLDRIQGVVDLLGDPQAAVPVIHVAGTNGKTSTARMIESLLRAFGLRTGLFTSPHLHSVRERIRLDGDAVDIERFVRVHDDVRPYLNFVDRRSIESGGPLLSFFEVMTAMAYATFADAPVDVAVIETGMGGTWDATNVADGTVAVITPIAFDHMDYLGDTLAKIAGEKAGIIKPGASVVLAAQELEVAEVLLRRCVETEATVAREGVEFGVVSRASAVGGQVVSLQGPSGVYDEIFLPLFGAHQATNAALALAAVEAFLGGGSAALNPELVRVGFASVASPGRLEVVRRGPTVVVDAAHNPHGARALAVAISDAFEFTSLVGVVAVLADKDARGLLEALEPLLAEVIVTRSSSPRAVDVDTLAALAVEVFGADRVEVSSRLGDALDIAIARADEAAAELGGGSGVLVTGSVVTAAEARALLGRADA
jgi:dihydrofolate synthase/folylpolyglutamate synthase